MARCYDWTAELCPNWGDIKDAPSHLRMVQSPDGKFVQIGSEQVPADYREPDFNELKKMGKHVHQWRSYISEAMQRIWSTFSDVQKAIIATNAQGIADREEWE